VQVEEELLIRSMYYLSWVTLDIEWGAEHKVSLGRTSEIVLFRVEIYRRPLPLQVVTHNDQYNEFNLAILIISL
jgi:hypothetical protein